MPPAMLNAALHHAKQVVGLPPSFRSRSCAAASSERMCSWSGNALNAELQRAIGVAGGMLESSAEPEENLDFRMSSSSRCIPRSKWTPLLRKRAFARTTPEASPSRGLQPKARRCVAVLRHISPKASKKQTVRTQLVQVAQPKAPRRLRQMNAVVFLFENRNTMFRTKRWRALSRGRSQMHRVVAGAGIEDR